MIILRLLGGLGNQLFIYSFGRALEINYNFDVSYDVHSGFQKDTYKRNYVLDYFNIKQNKSSIIDSFYFPIKKRSSLATKIIFPSSRYLKEDVDVLQNLTRDKSGFKKIFLEGYFQKEEYFKSIKNILCREITPAKKLSDKANRYLEEILKNNSVAVHVRRKGISSLTPLQFYFDNLKLITKRLENPKFIFFSDDITWCQKNFKDNFDTTIIDKTYNHLEDFWLMKNCKHFIIPGSTFSWWAAWLSDSRSKIVIKYESKT